MNMITNTNKITQKNKLGMSDRAFNILVISIVTIFMIIILYPVIFVVSASLSSARALTAGRVFLWPVEFNLKGYQMVLNNKLVLSGFANSVFFAFCGVVQHMFYTICAAYVLSRKDFKAKGFVMLLFLIPGWFSGGLIPQYIQYSSLGMTNNRWGYVFLAGFALGNVVIMRTYFQTSIPEDLLEAGKMDGISDLGYLLKIAIPLAKPVIAVITLYYTVGNWNDYFGPMIYLRDQDLQTLQLILRQILNASRVDASQLVNSSLAQEMAQQAEVMKYALIVITALPIIIIYPFIRKFFEKGVMVGSLKG